MMPPARGLRVRRERGLLDRALRGREDQEAVRRRTRAPAIVVAMLLVRLAASSRLTIALPLAARPDLRDLVDLEPVDAARASVKNEHVAVRGGDEEVLDEVLVLGLHRRCAPCRRGSARGRATAAMRLM